MSDYPFETHLMLRLILALVCGAFLGYERERQGRSAGLRTNLLVCVGAALMMVVSKYFYYKPGEYIGTISVALDPSRIAAQIVTGIGFLGAGVIIKDRGATRGLTTAATLWFNAGVGMACGAGMIILPVFCTIIGLVSLTMLKHFENKIPKDRYKTIRIECNEIADEALATLKDYLAQIKVDIVNVNYVKNVKLGTIEYDFVVKSNWQENELLFNLDGIADFGFVNLVRLG